MTGMASPLPLAKQPADAQCVTRCRGTGAHPSTTRFVVQSTVAIAPAGFKGVIATVPLDSEGSYRTQPGANRHSACTVRDFYRGQFGRGPFELPRGRPGADRYRSNRDIRRGRSDCGCLAGLRGAVAGKISGPIARSRCEHPGEARFSLWTSAIPRLSPGI
jgi:hypothetical protein